MIYMFYFDFVWLEKFVGNSMLKISETIYCFKQTGPFSVRFGSQNVRFVNNNERYRYEVIDRNYRYFDDRYKRAVYRCFIDEKPLLIDLKLSIIDNLSTYRLITSY
jgi:hypothetical protein